jgi:hypothetical protein
MAALTGHGGESRVILTSRIPPAGLTESVLPLPVHALDLAESAALARELPGLRGLLHADAGPVRADEAAVAADRDLVRRVLHVVQGHPKLMELADAAATAGPARLTAQLDTAETAAGGQVLDAFFRDGTTALDAAQFLDTLTAWTATTLDGLPTPARPMAQFLACLEEGDRQSRVIDANWADLWRRLGQPGDPPGPAHLLATLTAAALIQPDPPPGQDQHSSAPVTYRIHPGIAQAIRAAAPGVQAATDTELAATWRQVFDQARQREGGEAGRAIIRTGLAAAPTCSACNNGKPPGVFSSKLCCGIGRLPPSRLPCPPCGPSPMPPRHPRILAGWPARWRASTQPRPKHYCAPHSLRQPTRIS